MFIHKYTLVLTVIFLWNSSCHGHLLKLYRDSTASEEDYPICQEGKRQSPINLGPSARIQKVKSLPIDFANYNNLNTVPIIIGTDGHTVNSTSEWENKNLYITGDTTNGERYKFLDLHLHWATPRRPGTEHAFYGKRYSAELHLVHINEKYKDMSEALNYPDGILVLGALLKTSNLPPDSDEYLLEVTESNDDTAVFNFSFDKFNKITSFYNYNGSLTTPPCTENVQWVVPANLFAISRDSVSALRRLSEYNEDPSNVRELQKLNHRTVMRYELANSHSLLFELLYGSNYLIIL